MFILQKVYVCTRHSYIHIYMATVYNAELLFLCTALLFSTPASWQPYSTGSGEELFAICGSTYQQRVASWRATEGGILRIASGMAVQTTTVDQCFFRSIERKRVYGMFNGFAISVPRDTTSQQLLSEFGPRMKEKNHGGCFHKYGLVGNDSITRRP